MVTGSDCAFSGHARVEQHSAYPDTRVEQHSVYPNSSPDVHHGNVDVCWPRWYSQIYCAHTCTGDFRVCSGCTISKCRGRVLLSCLKKVLISLQISPISHFRTLYRPPGKLKQSRPAKRLVFYTGILNVKNGVSSMMSDFFSFVLVARLQNGDNDKLWNTIKYLWSRLDQW